jgi:Beta-lactamase enzyme family/Immunoglobulin domain
MSFIHRTLTALAFMAALAGPALGQSDRSLTTPTGWIWLYGGASSDLTTYINQGYRPFSLDRNSGTSFDTVMVANSGAYNHSGWGYFTGTTPANLSSWLSTNNERLIDLKPYDNGGTVGFAACAISNTGADAAAWGWLYNATSTDINNWMAANPTQRLISLNRYTVGANAYYAGVSVSNTGANATGWWYYYDQTASQISSLVNTNNARLTHLQCTVPPTVSTPARFTCIMVSNTGAGWWWYPALTAQQVVDYTGLNAARLVNLDRYTDQNGNTVFATLMIDNANALTQQVRSVISSGLSTGVGGGYMKEVGGAEFCSVGADYVFEPASMMKILYATYCIDSCAAGSDNLANPIFVANRCDPNACPDTVAPCNSGNDTLDTALALMLQNSDNNRTKSIHDRYGRTTLNNYAAFLGMASTHINHDIGCGQPPNQLTLRDAGHLYELIANGSLFNQSWEDTLHQHMLNNDGNVGSFNTYINTEAASTNLTPAEISTFKGLCYMAQKGGSYGVPPPGGGGCCVYDITNGGWMKLPFKDGNGNIVYHEYVIESMTNNEPNQSAAGTTNGNIWWTMARDRIRAALQSWDNACTTIVVTNDPDAVTVRTGLSTQFSVSSTGTAPTYQWRRNNVNISNGAGPGGSTITGATTATLHINNVSTLNAGTYTCFLSNVCSSDLSLGALLTVTTCGSADFDCDGDIGTDADIQAFFACLSGHCPSAPCTSDADFNGDGDIGTDADIESFFRVLSGGPC